MKFKRVINEVVDMTKQQMPKNWQDARRVWNELAARGKVYPTDHNGFISFERFFVSFLDKTGREPTVVDAIEEFIKKSPTYRGTV